MEMSATELKQQSGRALDSAQRDPVKIMKHGRLYGAVISGPDLEVLEEAKKADRLKKAVQAGFAQIEADDSSSRSMKDLATEAIQRVESKK